MRSNISALIVFASVLAIAPAARAVVAVARNPFNGTAHTVIQNPDGSYDVTLLTTVVTQPTTFTIIGAATDRINLIEVTANIPQLVFIDIRGSAGGTIQSLNQIDMGASTGTVLVRDLFTSGDVGSVFVNTIINMVVGGNLTGGINLLQRTNGGSATLIGARIEGRILGDVIVDYGDILDLTAVQGIGGPGIPMQIRTSGNITKLIAGEIYANISTLSAGGNGAVSELRTTSGPFVGTLNTRALQSTEPGSISRFAVAGDLDADVIILEDVANHNAGLPVITLGSNLIAGREIVIGRSLLPGAEIRITPSQGLQGQVLINANDAGGVWSGAVRVGASLLGPVPNYSATSSSLGSGSVGQTPFNIHLTDSSPQSSTIINASVAPSTSNPIILQFYGPVTWNNAASPLILERRPSGSTGAWTDVSVCAIVGLEPGPAPSPNAVAVFPLNPLAPGFTYRVTPLLVGVSRLQCDLGLQINPSVAAPASPYTFTIVGGCAGDANSDTSINFTDITSVLANWGATSLCSTDGDANFDGSVNFSDITSVLANWGINCTIASAMPLNLIDERDALAAAAQRLGFANVQLLQAWMQSRPTPELRKSVYELGAAIAAQQVLAEVETQD